MRMLKFATLGVAAVAFVGLAAPASAQATRTWVSGVGDDANPCSRTAPCKTFAGAISKTATGGEINCLDPGGFGGVTITKAMSIVCQYTEGGVLVAGAGVNGVVINAPATSNVYLRGLDIFGVGTAQNGVRFIAGQSLTIEDSVIHGFAATNGFGISFQPSGASRLYMHNVSVARNGNSAGTGGGILIQPTGASGSARADMNNVRLQENAGVGLKIDTTGNTSATGTLVGIGDSEFSGSPIGISAIMPAGSSTVQVMVQDTLVNLNTAFGVAATGTGTAVIRVSGSTLTGNATAILSSGGGTVRSYGDNLNDGNTAVSTFSGVDLTKD